MAPAVDSLIGSETREAFERLRLELHLLLYLALQCVALRAALLGLRHESAEWILLRHREANEAKHVRPLEPQRESSALRESALVVAIDLRIREGRKH